MSSLSSLVQCKVDKQFLTGNSVSHRLWSPVLLFQALDSFNSGRALLQFNITIPVSEKPWEDREQKRQPTSHSGVSRAEEYTVLGNWAANLISWLHPSRREKRKDVVPP